MFHVLIEVGDHETTFSSMLRNLDQIYKSSISRGVLNKARHVLHLWPAPRSPPIYPSEEYLFFQTVPSQCATKESKLSRPYHSHQLLPHSTQLKHPLVCNPFSPRNSAHSYQDPHFRCLQLFLQFLTSVQAGFHTINLTIQNTSTV